MQADDIAFFQHCFEQFGPLGLQDIGFAPDPQTGGLTLVFAFDGTAQEAAGGVMAQLPPHYKGAPIRAVGLQRLPMQLANGKMMFLN